MSLVFFKDKKKGAYVADFNIFKKLSKKKKIILKALLVTIFTVCVINYYVDISLTINIIIIGFSTCFGLLYVSVNGIQTSPNFNDINDINEPKPRPLSKNWRITLNVLFFAVAVFIIGYKIINHIELQTTSALFIGLPMLIGLLVVNLTRTRDTFEMTVKVTVIILCLVAPLLGEGSICILMMAPIFLGINLILVLIYQSIRNKYLMCLMVFLPFFTGFIEKNSLIQEQKFLKMTTETIVTGTLEQWQNKISSSTYISKNIPFFLSLGFPLPTKISDHDSQMLINFDKGGSWEVNKKVKKGSIRYTLMKDTSKINNWIKIKDSHVKITKINSKKTLIKQTTNYYSKVFPRWYFSPFQKLAVKQLHQLAISSWKTI